MLLLPPTKLEWDSADAAKLQDFIQSSTGQRLLGYLSHAAPLFLDGTNANKTLVAGGRVEGYQEAVANIVRLTHENPADPVPQKSEYPSLDDDTAWVAVDGKPQSSTS